MLIICCIYITRKNFSMYFHLIHHSPYHQNPSFLSLNTILYISTHHHLYHQISLYALSNLIFNIIKYPSYYYISYITIFPICIHITIIFHSYNFHILPRFLGTSICCSFPYIPSTDIFHLLPWYPYSCNSQYLTYSQKLALLCIVSYCETMLHIVARYTILCTSCSIFSSCTLYFTLLKATFIFFISSFSGHFYSQKVQIAAFSL